MLQSLSLLYHAEKFGKLQTIALNEDSRVVSTTFLGAPSAENMPEMLQSLELLHHAEKLGKSHIL